MKKSILSNFFFRVSFQSCPHHKLVTFWNICVQQTQFGCFTLCCIFSSDLLTFFVGKCLFWKWKHGRQSVIDPVHSDLDKVSCWPLYCGVDSLSLSLLERERGVGFHICLWTDHREFENESEGEKREMREKKRQKSKQDFQKLK